MQNTSEIAIVGAKAKHLHVLGAIVGAKAKAKATLINGTTKAKAKVEKGERCCDLWCGGPVDLHQAPVVHDVPVETVRCLDNQTPVVECDSPRIY